MLTWYNFAMTKFLILNWKMNPETLAGARVLFEKTKKSAQRARSVAVVVAPAQVHLASLASRFRGKSLSFAVQNMHAQPSGSYTGATSALQAHDAGATHAIIGHAERRALGETNEEVHDKVHAALDERLTPVVCVGERERDSEGAYVHEVCEQIASALADVPEKRFKDIIIAYEPVWAIGAPKAPAPNEVHQMIVLVRKAVADAFGIAASSAVRVLYGGAVHAENAEAIFAVPGLDGVLVGRASLDPILVDTLIKIASRAAK